MIIAAVGDLPHERCGEKLGCVRIDKDPIRFAKENAPCRVSSAKTCLGSRACPLSPSRDENLCANPADQTRNNNLIQLAPLDDGVSLACVLSQVSAPENCLVDQQGCPTHS
jgi:hypothetical protein